MMAWRSQRTEARWQVSAIVASALLAGYLTMGCAPPDRSATTSASGPEWQTVLRSGPGAASANAPAQLAEVTVDEHPGFDRLVFEFTGNRPGYRVEYGEDDAHLLKVTLYDALSSTADDLTPRLPAIREVHQSPAAEGSTRTEVTVSAEHLQFRVALSVGEFYVDVAHAGAV
jgi:hypothetical protein